MFGIGVPELAIILVIALIFFGAGKLPEIGGAVGKTMKNFRKEIKEGNEPKREVIEAKEIKEDKNS